MGFMHTRIESLDEWNYRTPSHFPTFLKSHTRISFKITGLLVKIIGLLLLYHSETCKCWGMVIGRSQASVGWPNGWWSVVGGGGVDRRGVMVDIQFRTNHRRECG